MCCNLTRANDFFPGVITRHPSAYLLEPPLALPAAAKQGPTAMGAAAVLLVTLVGSVAASEPGVCENWYVHPSQPCVSFCQEAVHSDSCQRLPLGVALFPGDCWPSLRDATHCRSFGFLHARHAAHPTSCLRPTSTRVPGTAPCEASPAHQGGGGRFAC